MALNSKTCPSQVWGSPPVDASNDTVQGERRVHVTILTPDGMAVMVLRAVVRCIEGIDHSRDNDKKPCYDSENLVRQKIG